jgi:hypothetical protein
MQFEHEGGQDYLILSPREAQYINTYAEGVLAVRSSTELIEAYAMLFVDHINAAQLKLNQLKEQHMLSRDTIATFTLSRTIALLTDSLDDIITYQRGRSAQTYYDLFDEPPLPPSS